ncbi:MAG: glycosyltransferase family 2 protein [Anaerolineales bacterium]
MNDRPLVSIITPSFNQAAFLEETIHSVISQDYPSIEYWIIDGGSTDGSLEIIKQYAHQLKGWVSERDAGQADAINKGLQKASGEVLAWLNSDDLYRPGAIKRAVKQLYANPDVGLVYSDVDSIDEYGETFNRMRYGHWQLQDLMAFNIIGQSSVFFRRSVFESAGYLDPSYHYMLDHHLWLRMALTTKLKYMPGEVWAAARMHESAKNVAEGEGFGREAYRLVAWMHADQRFKPYLENHTHKVWAGAHRVNAFYLLDSGKPREALRAYWRGFWSYSPTVLQDWRRILFALLSPFGVDRLRSRYLERRKTRLNQVESEVAKDYER